MTDYEQAYRDQRAALRTLAYDMRRGWKHVSNGSDAATLVEKTLASSAPATASEHQQRADHYQYLYEQASEGKCGHSGLTIGACKASICDCFEFPWVKAAPDEHPDPATGVTSSDGDRGLSEEERDWYFRGVAESYKDDEDWGDVMRHVLDLQERLAARTAQPEGVERVEWGVRGRPGYGSQIATWTTDPGGVTRQYDESLARLDAGPGQLFRRTVTEYAPVVGPWEVVGDE